MGTSTGLAALRAKVEKAAEGGGDFVKTRWVKIAGGQSLKVRFLQEIDPDSPNYNPDHGLALIASEISDPSDYTKKCLSTLEDEGKCYGLEQHAVLQGTEGYKGGWKPRSRLYVNVLAFPDNGDDPYVAVLSQGMGGKQITPTLLEYAEETKSITDKVFKIKRTGSDLSGTSYGLMLVSTDPTPFDYDGIELYDLDKVAVRHVPYAEQAAFFGKTAEQAPDSSTDVDW